MVSANFDCNPTVVRKRTSFIISRDRPLGDIWSFFFIRGDTKCVLFIIVSDSSQQLILLIHRYEIFYNQVLHFQISVNYLNTYIKYCTTHTHARPCACARTHTYICAHGHTQTSLLHHFTVQTQLFQSSCHVHVLELRYQYTIF